MILKHDLLNKITQLQNKAVSQGKNKSMMADLLSPLDAAIYAYYTLTGVDKAIRNCILAITHSQIRCGIEYEDGTKPNQITTNAPLGYNDITELFNVGSDIMTTTDTRFINSIKLVQEFDVDGVTVLNEKYESPLVDAWTVEFVGEVAGEGGLLSKLATVAAHASGAGLIDPLKFMMEPSRMTSVPNLTDISKDIYWNRKYLDLIDAWELDIYVPTNCRVGR